MDVAHPIFRQPIHIQIPWQSTPTPAHYAKVNLAPQELKTWQVNDSPSLEPGLVADPYGFEDSPDCERISGGLNSKSPDAMALARQGNWFLWGFSSAPNTMTRTARMTFVNTIVYMKQFRGKRPLIHNPCLARQWALKLATTFSKSPVGATAQARRTFAESVLKEADFDLDRLRDLIRSDSDYIRQVDGMFMIDTDARELRIANNNLELLDKCVSMLETGDRSDLAARLLQKYVSSGPATGGSPGDWRAWLSSVRNRLYFSDRGGYRYIVRSDQ